MGEHAVNRIRLVGVVAVSAVVVASLSTAASGAAGESGSITLSGPSPLAHCPGLPGTITNFTAEPSMAVNPRNRDNIVVAWQQDRSYASRGNVVSYSRDGGRTWREVTVPGADTCTPGQLGVADAWLTFDTAGNVYLASLVGRPAADGTSFVTAVIVNRSVDGGATWSAPTDITNFTAFDDKPSITADPNRAGVVYATWERSGADCEGSGPCRSAIYFSKSIDGGQTWSAPSPVAPSSEQQHNARIVILPSGALRLFYEEWPPTTEPGPGGVTRDLEMASSSDGGANWGAPQAVMQLRQFLPADASGHQFFALYDEAVTADQRGILYAVSTENASAASDTPSTVNLRISRDGGSTWAQPKTIARSAGAAILPSIAVSSPGLVGVTWYDFADGQSSGFVWPLAYRAAAAPVTARRWPVRTLAQFDASKCGNFSEPGLPGPKLPWIGEYFGLSQLYGVHFGTAYSVCAPAAHVGLEDIVFSKF
jgi:hypothetical protein